MRRDRVGLAMNLDVPDRVPVFCQLAIGHYFLNARPSPFDVWFRSGAFANALVELREHRSGSISKMRRSYFFCDAPSHGVSPTMQRSTCLNS